MEVNARSVYDYNANMICFDTISSRIDVVKNLLKIKERAKSENWHQGKLVNILTKLKNFANYKFIEDEPLYIGNNPNKYTNLGKYYKLNKQKNSLEMCELYAYQLFDDIVFLVKYSKRLGDEDGTTLKNLTSFDKNKYKNVLEELRTAHHRYNLIFNQ